MPRRTIGFQPVGQWTGSSRRGWNLVALWAASWDTWVFDKLENSSYGPGAYAPPYDRFSTCRSMDEVITREGRNLVALWAASWDTWVFDKLENSSYGPGASAPPYDRFSTCRSIDVGIARRAERRRAVGGVLGHLGVRQIGKFVVRTRGGRPAVR